jgi:hypothetical protein
MGDKSPKDREKKKKQHDREIAEINRSKQDKQSKPNAGGNTGQDPQRKAG